MPGPVGDFLYDRETLASEDLAACRRYDDHQIVIFDVGVFQFLERDPLRIVGTEVGTIVTGEMQVASARSRDHHQKDRNRNDAPSILYDPARERRFKLMH